MAKKLFFIPLNLNMAQKPTLPKGTRDFGPLEMSRRNYLLSTIQSVFEKYGFAPLQTPALENLSVLTGKYGDEGDQLLFKILNNGLENSKNGAKAQLGFEQVLAGKNDERLTERALRYDLTVPFARFVVMNQQNITFPFRRYQIQPVWRADRPQKGRYREFYQCDADVIGTDSLLCEAEIVLMIQEVFNKLGLQDYAIKVNNRKVLNGLAELIGAADNPTAFYVAIDKLDKIGVEGVLKELQEGGFDQTGLNKLKPLIEAQQAGKITFAYLEELLASSEIGMKGLAELKEIWSMTKALGKLPDQLELDLTLARGLSYYTGAIFEVKPTSVQMGSICGGGRYDDLTGIFGLKNMSGVGISFGIDRIYDVLNELELYPEAVQAGTQVLLCRFSDNELKPALEVLKGLRKASIRAELYPDAVKMRKQLDYANKKGIPYVILLGENEVKEQRVSLKNMQSGEQTELSISDLVQHIK